MRQKVVRNGITWMLDTKSGMFNSCIDRAIDQTGIWEAMSTAHVNRIVKPGWHCLDIGANFGYYSVLLSRLVGPSGRVVAVEPLDSMFSLLLEHSKLNNCSNISHIKRTLGSGDLDRVVKYCRGKINFIKIDVDGQDLEILRMLEPLLLPKNGPDCLMVEVCEATLRKVEGLAPYGRWSTELLEIPRRAGYTLHKEKNWGVIADPSEYVQSRPLLKRSDNVFAVRTRS